MTPRDRQLAVIRHEVPDRISTDAMAVENAEAVAATLGIEKEEVPVHLGLDGRGISLSYGGDPTAGPAGETLNEWGTSANNAYGAGHYYPLAGMTNIHDAETHAWPAPSRCKYDESATRAAELCNNYATRGPCWNPLFCRVCSLVGMEEVLVNMMVQPALFEAVLEKVFEITYEVCRRFTEACADNLDILNIGDDFATQRNLMFEPELWRRYLKPRYAKLFELGKQAGKHIWFHSCGDVTSVLPDLIDIGMDVWETVQLHTLPMTPHQLKREYGKHITFMGSINTQRFPFATTDEVREEVVRVCEALGEGGGFICAPDHHIKPDVPPENVIALYEAAQSFRKSNYTHEE